MTGARDFPAGTRTQTWDSFVESQLPAIWSAAVEFGLEPRDVEAVTQTVLLRLLEWTSAQHVIPDPGPLVDSIVQSVVREECERIRRRRTWQARAAADGADHDGYDPPQHAGSP